MAQAMGTIIAVTLVVFLFMQIAGNPAALLVPEYASVEDIARMRERLGLDRPWHVQYVHFMLHLWQGDAIRSFRYDRPVLGLVLRHLRWTLVLAGTALVLAVVLALPLGTVAALKRGTGIDVAIRLVAVSGQSLPSFWVAMLLMLFFAVKLQLFPVSGLGWKHAVLPVATLSFLQLAVLLRLFRSEMLEVMSQDYIRTARSKGVREAVVVVRHAFKNAAIPVLTMAGLQLSSLVLGAVVVEPIFAWPGLGWLLVNSVMAFDYPVVLGSVILAVILVTLVNLVVDVMYGWLDPRIRIT
jgi:ABC-type dipeptide/oligopeptide/nickel transport system permease component